MHPGGTAFIIDNDYAHGEFASWLEQRVRKGPLSQEEKERFWASYGFLSKRIESEWRFRTRKDLEAVVRLEFGDKLGNVILGGHKGLTVGYSYRLYYRAY
jgi:hypothetical protein